MNDTPQAAYVEFNDPDPDTTFESTIMHDPWLAKWKAMNPVELQAEFDTLLDKVALVENEKISAQLIEVLDLLKDFRNKRKA